MALVSVAPFGWPGHALPTIAAAPTLANDTTISTGVHLMYVGTARQAMTISHVGFMAGTVTAAGTVSVSIRSIGTDGLDSADWDTNTNLTAQSVTQNTWNLYALTASASIAAGQVFGVKIEYGGSGTSFIVRRITGLRNTTFNIPYEIVTGTKARVSALKSLAVGSSTSSFYQLDGALPATAATSAAINTGTSTTREGLRFKVAFACRCVGIRWWNSTSVGDYVVMLRDDGGTELSSSSTAFEGDQGANSAGGICVVHFDNPVTLSADTWYRATVEPSSATSVTVSEITIAGTDYFGAVPGGINNHLTRYTTGAWDDTNTSIIPVMDIIIDQIHDGASTGGGARIIGG
jgi:hypothetical protein